MNPISLAWRSSHRHSLCESVDWNGRKIIKNTPDVCHSLCESVDWNSIVLSPIGCLNGHSLCESVDWNIKTLFRTADNSRHSLCESVDWNSNLVPNNVSGVVTLFVRVWIEITTYLTYVVLPLSLSLWECGLKLPLFLALFCICTSHSLCESVDWNIKTHIVDYEKICHSLCESVDWNRRTVISWKPTWVTLFVRVWIEMLRQFCERERLCKSLSLWECGLKSHSPQDNMTVKASLSLWECGLKLKFSQT